MKTKLLFAALAATFTLAGCGNPASSNAGTDSSNASTVDSVITWTKKLVRGWTVKASVTEPAQGVIADALLDPAFVGGNFSGHISASNVRGAAPIIGVGGFVHPGEQQAKDRSDNQPYLVPVGAVIGAYRGWEINLMSGFGGAVATSKEKSDYLGFQEAAADYTNTLFTQIASKLNNDIGILEDPETAKKEIQRIFSAIPRAELRNMWILSAKRAESNGHRTIDMTGTKGVDWSNDNGSSYSGEADGLTWTKSGITWFGKGNLSGKDWKISLESSVSKSADKSSSGSETNSGGTVEKSGSAAQPK